MKQQGIYAVGPKCKAQALCFRTVIARDGGIKVKRKISIYVEREWKAKEIRESTEKRRWERKSGLFSSMFQHCTACTRLWELRQEWLGGWRGGSEGWTNKCDERLLKG